MSDPVGTTHDKTRAKSDPPVSPSGGHRPRMMVALDATDASRRALEFALRILPPGCSLSLLTVQEKFHRGDDQTTAPDVLGRLEEKARATLQSFVRRCEEAQVSVSCHVAKSFDVKVAIIQAVDQLDIDVLVVGRRALSRIRRVFTASVSDFCIRCCPCAVIVVK